MFGRSGLYYLGHANVRAASARDIDEKARTHERELEKILLKHAVDDCTRWKTSFDKKFKERFNSTLNNKTWLETATRDTLADIKATGLSTNFIAN